MLPCLIALALAALATLCPAPASAASYVATYASAITVDGQAAPSPAPNGGGFSFSGSLRQTATVTVTATMTWTPSGPLDTTPPPPHPSFLESLSAGGGGDGGPGASITCTDGANDATTDIATPLYGGQVTELSTGSGGSHLLQNQSGSVVVLPSRTMSVTVTNGWGVRCGFSYSVQQDSRNAMVSSSFSPTNRKGPNNTPLPNVRQNDGSLTDDTVVPGPNGVSVSYSPIVIGTWGSNSQYDWQASLPPAGGAAASESGVFNSTAWFGNITVPDFPSNGLGRYFAPPATDGASDTITLKLTDGQDGASGTGTYTVRFHNPWSNLIPDPANPTTDHYSYYNAYVPGGGMLWVNGPAASATWTFTITGTATMATAFTAGFTVADFVNLGGSFTPSISFSVGTSFGVTSVAIDNGYHTYPYVQFHYQTKHYLVDHYTTSGYSGAPPQSADDPNSKTVSPGWAPEQRSDNWAVYY